MTARNVAPRSCHASRFSDIAVEPARRRHTPGVIFSHTPRSIAPPSVGGNRPTRRRSAQRNAEELERRRAADPERFRRRQREYRARRMDTSPLKTREIERRACLKNKYPTFPDWLIDAYVEMWAVRRKLREEAA